MKIIAPFATTVAAAALLTAGAVAQTTPPATNTTPTTPPAQTQTTPSTTPVASITQQSANQWRGSQLIGLNVYNDQNEKGGDVTELITNSNGQVEAIVVGVGGFLGIGRHDVALRWEDLRFVRRMQRHRRQRPLPMPRRRRLRRHRLQRRQPERTPIVRFRITPSST